MLAIKVHRVDEENKLYVLETRLNPVSKRLEYVGGGTKGAWAGVLKRVSQVPSSTQVVVKLYEQWKNMEPVWRVDIQHHGALVRALTSDDPKRIVEVVPKAVLDILMKPSPNHPVDTWRTDLELKDFQKEGVKFIIRNGGRGIIADEMGLGKTYQGLGIIEHYKDLNPKLVICPSAVMDSWHNHLLEHYHDKTRVKRIENWKSEFVQDGVNILSLGMLTQPKFAPAMNNFRPAVMIVDESHYVKNGQAQRTKRVFQWSTLARVVVLLTGTPMDRPHELYSQIKCVNRNLFKNFFHFKKDLSVSGLATNKHEPKTFFYACRYCQADFQYRGPVATPVYKGCENEAELHAILRQHVVIRRLKQQVFKEGELPEKFRERIIIDSWKQDVPDCDDTSSQNFMEAVRETAKHKIPAVQRYIHEILVPALENNPKLKVLIWAHHHVMHDALKETLDKEEIRHVVMNGETPTKQRDDGVKNFQKDPDIRVAVLGMNMSTGVTMTAATLNLFAELVFTPNVLLQAEDRAHRIGQTENVISRYLICEGTTDTVMWNLLSAKVRNTSMCLDGKPDAPGWRQTKKVDMTSKRQKTENGEARPVDFDALDEE